jgi:hypothetical protein
MRIRDSVVFVTGANRGIGLSDELGIYLNFDPDDTVPAAR